MHLSRLLFAAGLVGIVVAAADPASAAPDAPARARIGPNTLATYTVATQVDLVDVAPATVAAPYYVQCAVSRFFPASSLGPAHSLFFGDKRVLVPASAGTNGIVEYSGVVSMDISRMGQGTAGPAPAMQATCSLENGPNAAFHAATGSSVVQNERDDFPTRSPRLMLPTGLKLVGLPTAPVTLSTYTVSTQVDLAVRAAAVPGPYYVSCSVARFFPATGTSGVKAFFFGDKQVLIPATAGPNGLVRYSGKISMDISRMGQGTAGPAPTMQASCSLENGPNGGAFHAAPPGSTVQNAKNDFPTETQALVMPTGLRLGGP